MKYIAWVKKEYVYEGKLLEALKESIEYGTGDQVKFPTDTKVYEDGNYLITQTRTDIVICF